MRTQIIERDGKFLVEDMNAGAYIQTCKTMAEAKIAERHAHMRAGDIAESRRETERICGSNIPSGYFD